MTTEKPQTSKVTARIESLNVGPDLASLILEGNEGNRPIRDTRVEAYARAMIAGNWTLSDSMICVSKQNKLLNGQHRLKAVVHSGCTVPMTIYWDCPESAYAHMDAGAKRSASDYLAHRGIQNTTYIAALVKLIIAYRLTGKYIASLGIAPSFDDIHTEYSNDPEGYQQAVCLARYGKNLLSATALGAIAYLASEKYAHKTVESFFSSIQVSKIGDMPKYDPRRTLIECVVKTKMRNRASIPFEIQANTIAKAFLKYAKGESCQVLQWKDSEKTIEL